MKMKMYILIKESISLGYAMVASAHASLSCYLKFQDTPEMQKWLSSSFRKVVCVVNDKEFEKVKSVADNVILTESTLNKQEVAIAFNPREEWPTYFKFLRLYNQNELPG